MGQNNIFFYARSNGMSLVIPNQVLQVANLSAEELMQDIAVMLFERERLTLGQASKLANLNRLSFQRLLASQKIPIHYDSHDFQADIETWRHLGEL